MILRSNEHPYWHVAAMVVSGAQPVESVELSFYHYLPQSLTDTRHVVTVGVESFLDLIYMERLISNCPSGAEVAIHSRVKMLNGEIKHIPMIDLSTATAAHLSKLRPFLNEDFDKFAWFKSGRSYHGYGGRFINSEELIDFMGRLLLVNQIGMPPTVDPRWVGHRLIAGYAALRWTKNTSQYTDIPRRIFPV